MADDEETAEGDPGDSATAEVEADASSDEYDIDEDEDSNAGSSDSKLDRFADPDDPHWVYMMSVSSTGLAEGVVGCSPHIGVTRRPLARVAEKNGLVDYGRFQSRDTRKGAPFWKLDLAIGPFYNNGANLFRTEWMKNSRKWERRMRYGVRKAMKHPGKLEVFCFSISELVSLLSDEGSGGASGGGGGGGGSKVTRN